MVGWFVRLSSNSEVDGSRYFADPIDTTQRRAHRGGGDADDRSRRLRVGRGSKAEELRTPGEQTSTLDALGAFSSSALL